MTNLKKSRIIGICLVLTGAILWGVSGSVAQYLFEEHGFNAEWLVVIRLLSAGILMLSIAIMTGNENVWEIWKTPMNRVKIIVFGICGMLGVQYTYFAAIEASNAATATLLQYTGPVMIVLYLLLRHKVAPTKYQVMAIILALTGTFLLVTHGNYTTLSISGWALFWGLASAVGLAIYTLQPIKLLKEFGSGVVVGWGMIIGGIGMSFIHPPWNIVGELTVPSIIAVIFIIIFGTIIAFFSYLESLKYLKPTEASLLACAEPLSAAIIAVIWLNVVFGLSEWIGAFCIITTVAILSFGKEKEKETSENQSYEEVG
ncbi:DMT family transporter [Bacillus sp. FJAT-45350]|uniref:DMT family transporter n=1 Tax=Bacillus sp. FJAT-45350 TaxID=2011014 RepID=UPI000BB842E6|nr:EamA family transporter [Bacillus sp. FJAT-45350]